MLDIKKTRGFHKIPASKLQREANTAASAAAATATDEHQQHHHHHHHHHQQQQQQQKSQQRGNSSNSHSHSHSQQQLAQAHQSQSQHQGTSRHAKSLKTSANSGPGVGVTVQKPVTSLKYAASNGPNGSSGRAAAAAAVGNVNPVRAANQRYFLVSSYKDPSFLKAECDLAHAQVTLKQAPAGGKTHKRNKALDDHKNNNSSNKSATAVIANGTGNGTSVSEMRRTTTLNGNKAGGTSSNSTNNTNSGANSSNRATTTTTTTTTTTASTGAGNSAVHRIDIKYSHSQSQSQSHSHSSKQQLTLGQKTTVAGGTTATSSSAGIGAGRLVAGKLKPLLLHCNNNHSAMNSHSSYNNNNNNNSSATNNSNSNNNMQRQQQQQQQQHDDISYIDSDDIPTSTAAAGAAAATAATTTTGSSAAIITTTTASGAISSSQKMTNICYFKPITPPLQLRNQQLGGDKSNGGQRSIRPKSTIVSFTNSNFAASYEKFNNYKHTNGEQRPKERERERDRVERDNSAGSSSNARRYGIDSVSIKASIEKFNNLSEQKRQPGPLRSNATTSASGSTAAAAAAAAVATAAAAAAAAEGTSNNAGGSSSNLQQRFSGDMEHTRIAAGYSSSLTRAAYRTGSSNSNTATATAATAAATAASSSAVAPMSKSASRIAHGLLAKAANSENAGTAMATTAAAAAAAAMTPTTTANAAANNSHKGSRNVASSVRSVLPPVSPTSSRYWDRDRDSGRNSTNATTSSIGSSSLSTKHNSLDEGYKSSRDEKFEGLCGLRNIGNTCFMNSVIQCLSHTTELTRFLRAHHTNTRTATSKDQQILYEFAKLIQEMWTSNVHSVTPMELKRAFSTKHRMYSDYNQQDAQEFLRFFLDSLHSALNTGVKGETLNIDDNLSDNKKADLTWEWYARHENSLIRDLFVGQLKSTLKCTTCGNTSVTFDPFWDLSVPLPSSSRCKLEACLDLFIREEVLDGDEMPTCSKCKTRRKCTKSFTIQRFPKYLVIHLKRFSETRWSKLSNIVEFPTADRELNMASYGANANSNVHYSLYAISNHMGSTAGGHYVAICKHPVSRKWHEFNDNSVSDAIPENCLVSSSAYILFYERA
ncbi:ubiquitin carboxyl-terminal hydrolase Usp2 isoform X2 [Drosophila mojavensis]|uniref:ubiquitin carboxyl-terminal hydrolase Usp2 isoform X2 n=1 Tax=Drosophila mojavensis TaxID=7230 RepID=UPI0013EEC21E|nr:ubiquitin carboxyl-terminal hydrolase Usp2 isoform X2 [Drosophila mojavensis]